MNYYGYKYKPLAWILVTKGKLMKIHKPSLQNSAICDLVMMGTRISDRPGIFSSSNPIELSESCEKQTLK